MPTGKGKREVATLPTPTRLIHLVFGMG